MTNHEYRIGIGYDIHKLTDNRNLIIGGIEIPYEKGLLGHSDADVLIHAIIDALLGALCMNDIGTLFPDSDEKFKDANSMILLEQTYKLIKNKGYLISNIDSNIIAQEPKMAPYIPLMKDNLSRILSIDFDDISVKAKTNENMDSVGEKRAIEANAVVMLQKI